MQPVPAIRIRDLNKGTARPDGGYVLYWMTANRRTRNNFSLQRALEWCTQLNRPLLVFEALRIGYRWASDRMHRFVLQGMADNRRALKDLPVRYYAYVEPEQGHGAGLLERLAADAAVVVTDDFPCFFLPAMLRLVSGRLDVKLETVDSNGLLPMRAADRVYPTAYAFRRFLQKELPAHFGGFPKPAPFQGLRLPVPPQIPRDVLDRWSEAGARLLEATTTALSALPIDHDVGPACFDGGAVAAEARLSRFLQEGLPRYAEERSQPESDAASGLSPYLHFGHVSVHEVFTRLVESEGWSPDAVSSDTKGAREGWWGMSANAESFLDELITWRELGYNMCWQRSDYDRFESLPDWALATLAEHEADERPYIYALEELESAGTHDELWNAAQRQLVREGRMHNYLRMLWGKKVLEWSETPREAAATLIHLNNKYAVDGRDPNSYSGIFWCLGRYDRPWGPERPIFGKVRYMSSQNTRRKFNVTCYLKRYAAGTQGQLWDG
jgi:deoxyribodipyrimidine photo-lyase